MSTGPQGRMLAFVLILLSSSVLVHSQERVLHTFSFSDGGLPQAGLVVDSHGDLFGTTSVGGPAGEGTVFKLSQNADGTWTQTVLYGFGSSNNDAAFPIGVLVFDAAGNIYGTTNQGGAEMQGTVFELSPATGGLWTEKILYSFSGFADGDMPYAGVSLDAAGNLYGTTAYGGANNLGIVFELVAGPNNTWTEKVLHSFTGGNDGGTPYAGQLVFDKAGNLFGTTLVGGTHDYGLVFELSPGSSGQWSEHNVHSFTGGAGGISAPGGVVFDRAGNLYVDAVSSVLQLTRGANGIWVAKDLHDFSGGSDGATAEGGLIVDPQGNVYGTTNGGGAHHGTVFELTPGQGGLWTEKVLHAFRGGADGINPFLASLAIDQRGLLYGTTFQGGSFNDGVVFQVKP